jgi:NADH-quinone oxidoreductase subunit G
MGRFPVGLIGPKVDLTYSYEHLGAGPQTLRELSEGNHPFTEVLERAARPMLILGQGALAREDGAAILNLAGRLAERTGMIKREWNGFSMLHTAAARVGGLDLKLLPGHGGRDVEGIIEGARSGAIALVFLLGADERPWREELGDAFVVYLGSHGDRGAHRADAILPGAAYTEKDATYVNTEGRVQRAARAVFPPGEAREDWAVLRALSERVNATLPYDTLDSLRRALAEDVPGFAALDQVEPPGSLQWARPGKEGPTRAAPFAMAVSDFYLTNPIARASSLMAELSKLSTERRLAVAAE